MNFYEELGGLLSKRKHFF